MCLEFKGFNKLLLISLSNIQNYISSARKAKDLYNGSLLVKNTILEIQRVLFDNTYMEKCFQFCDDDKVEETNIPNFLLYRIKTDENKDNRELEEEIYNILKENVDKSKVAYDLIPYIVIEDIEDDGYDEAYNKIYKKLGAYKNNRFRAKTFFEAKKEGEKVCYLCGIRYGNDVKQEDDDKIEYLCSECKKKRDYGREGFSSVDDIAKLQNKEGTYYALIRADIDNMGKWLSTIPKEYEAGGLLQWQKLLKEFIKEFIKKVEKSLEEITKEKKLLIYAGGDDLLFFCPIEQAISELKRVDTLLEETWKEKIVPYVQKMEDRITISKCIAIVHRKTPLKRVIQLSKNYLEETKNYKTEEKDNEKNKIGFLLILDGYEQVFSVVKMQEIELVEKLLLGIGTEISRSFIYELERETVIFGDIVGNEYEETVINIIKNDIQRVIERKSNYPQKYNDIIQRLYLQFRQYRKSHRLQLFFDLLHIIDKWNREMKC